MPDFTPVWQRCGKKEKRRATAEVAVAVLDPHTPPDKARRRRGDKIKILNERFED